jgi:hypothetical protein
VRAHRSGLAADPETPARTASDKRSLAGAPEAIRHLIDEVTLELRGDHLRMVLKAGGRDATGPTKEWVRRRILTNLFAGQDLNERKSGG